MNAAVPSVEQHFVGRAPEVRQTYNGLLACIRKIGPFSEDPKKTSIHLNRRTAFGGVATRKDALILTIKASRDIPSKRILKHEQASANRWHLEVRLSSPEDIDKELVSWLLEAYELSA